MTRVRHDHTHSVDDIYDLDVTPPVPINPSDSGLPEQWSASQSGQVIATADDNDEAVLTVKAPDGSEASGDLVFEVQSETGTTLMSMDPYGALVLRGSTVDPTNGGAYLSIISAAGTIFGFTADNGSGGSNARIGASDTELGFFGANPVAQPAAPVTLGDVIAALKALGLVAS